MYAGRVACCFLVSHGEYADGTGRRTDARPLHYAFCYGRCQHNSIHLDYIIELVTSKFLLTVNCLKINGLISVEKEIFKTFQTF